MLIAVIFLSGLSALAYFGWFGWPWVWLYLNLSLLCVVLYWVDKRAAKACGARISEVTLLWLIALGGWPGGLMACQLFHHKTVKQPFRFFFWCGGAVNCSLLAGYFYFRLV